MKFQEELLCMGTHLGRSPGLYHFLYHFPIFPVGHQSYLIEQLPSRNFQCSCWSQRPSAWTSLEVCYGYQACISQKIQSITDQRVNFDADYNYITRMKISPLSLLPLFLIIVVGDIPHLNKKQINQLIDETKINYGSTVRIKANAFAYYLHSHEVRYPRGSGQQSVTGFPMDDDYNSLWTIKEADDQTVKTYYHDLKCGDVIRLEHALTKRNLHSEEIYQSMITNGQEVSAFGNGGKGDDNDNWVLKCLRKQSGQLFYGGDIFELIHENTDKHLKMSRYYEYRFDNWEDCPFQGQIEVSAVDRATRQTEFKIVGGVFFKQKAKSASQREGENDDL